MARYSIFSSTRLQGFAPLILLIGLLSSNSVLAEDVPDAVQAVFANNCINGCHTLGNPNGGLILTDKTTSFMEMYEVNATCDAGSKIVKERDANASVLYSKINGGTPICGGSMPPGGTVSAADQVTIQDWINNLHPNGIISFAPASARPIIGETNGTITLNVTRGPGTAGDVQIDYDTADGTAEAVADYVAQSATLAFADGQTSNTITIDIIDDADVEGDENFFVQLSNVAGGAILGTAPRSEITIADDDDAPSPGVLLMNGNSISVDENAGTFDVIIRRAQGNEGAVSVTLNSSNGTAIAGTDYEAISQVTVSFANTISIQTVPLTIFDNDVFEGSKTFTLQISSAQGGAILGSPSTATVTILDDEPDPNASAGGGGGGGTEPPPTDIPAEEFRDKPESIGAIYWLLILLPIYRRFRKG